MALVRLLASAGLIDAKLADELRPLTEGAPNALDIVLQHVDEGVLAKLIADQFGFPLVALRREDLNADAIRLLPKEVVKRYGVVPLRQEGGALVVAFANPLDHGAVKAIEFAARCKVKIVVALASEVREAIHFAYDFQKEVARRLGNAAAPMDRMEILEPGFEDEIDIVLANSDDSGAAIRLVELIMVEGLASGASDIHVEPTNNAVNVRYRINGVMEKGVVVPKSMQLALIGRVKVMASLDISERRRPQDGSMSVRYEGRRVDVRVSILPTPTGEKIVMRLLDIEAQSHALDEMGYPEESLRVIREEAARSEGLILLTGPTGSGKTTTAHALLTEISANPLNIITLENPVEYRLKNVTQVEINEKQGMTFASALRSVLRQDPDVIFVGEIRDTETAEIALRAANTGHLVLSTLHTIDASSSISRLLDLGVDSRMVASSLRLVIAQRLMRELCQACRAPYVPTGADLARLGITDGSLTEAYRGTGCRKCRDRGYSGRFSVPEVLTVSRAMRPLLERRAPETEIRAQARADGVFSMHARALEAIRSGRSSIEEMLRVIPAETDDDVRGGSESAAPPPIAAPAPEGGHAAPDIAPTFPPSGRIEAPVVSPSAIAVSGLEDVPLSSPATTLTALVVDDEPVNRAVLRHCLTKVTLPLRVLMAEDGEQALKIADTEHVHILLADFIMPGINGIELCQRLRADPRYEAIPMFMLSAIEDMPQKTSAFEAGVDDYMVKPVNAAELVARVTRALHRAYPELIRPAGAAAGAGAGARAGAASRAAAVG